MRVEYPDIFDWNKEDERSRVFQIFPDVHGDSRGYFMEVVKDYGEWPHDGIPLWFSNLLWIRQINRSSSKRGVVRGCHAQKGLWCQGKLVEAVNEDIFDIIIDARPDSLSFGASSVFLLDAKAHNSLWIPRGFLHTVCFASNKSDAILQYYADGSYKKEAEFCVNPTTVIPKLVKTIEEKIDTFGIDSEKYSPLVEMFNGKNGEILYSDKDLAAIDYEKFMNEIKDDYENGKKVWYM